MNYKGNFIEGKFMIPAKRAGRLVSEDPGDLANPVGEILFSTDAVSGAV